VVESIDSGGGIAFERRIGRPDVTATFQFVSFSTGALRKFTHGKAGVALGAIYRERRGFRDSFRYGGGL